MRSMICLLLLIFPLKFTLAAESVEFSQKVSEEHGLSDKQAEALKNILTTDRSLTRNIGTEDPSAVSGPNQSWHPVDHHH